MNTLFVLFELIFTNLPPLPWIQLPATIVLLGLYLGVAYVTQSTQGFYPYTFLDPKEQGPLLAGYILGIAAGQIIVFVLVRYVIMLRIRVVGEKRPAAVEFNTHDIEGAAH
ncbi:hypothetical protein D9756_011301 [Leucocoprinus leucothites]|uniref:Uncharacterized protein n=1 Tax=Leucocoprinus leucothites TaxID=201217 RepID=A0A8H5FQI6_9AGAR|nr:hypothetical protein D9756_011301 [Leucoagaricus leucothites]